jgi:hypothetical protein
MANLVVKATQERTGLRAYHLTTQLGIRFLRREALKHGQPSIAWLVRCIVWTNDPSPLPPLFGHPARKTPSMAVPVEDILS